MKRYIAFLVFWAVAFSCMPQAYTMNKNLKKIHLKDSKKKRIKSTDIGEMAGLAIMSAVGAFLVAMTAYLAFTGKRYDSTTLTLDEHFWVKVSAIPSMLFGGLCLCPLYETTSSVIKSTFKNYPNDKCNIRSWVNPLGTRISLELDVDQRDKDGRTLLMHCCKDSDKMLTDLGLLAKTDLIARDNDEKVTIDKGYYLSKEIKKRDALSISMVRALIASGVDINALDNVGDAAISCARGRQVEALLVAGAIPKYAPSFSNSREEFDRLDHAEKQQYLDMLRERAQNIKEPTLAEAVHQYECAGFSESLKKWCGNNTHVNNLLNESVPVPLAVVEIICDYAVSDTHQSSLLNRALRIAAQENNQPLITMLHASGAQ